MEIFLKSPLKWYLGVFALFIFSVVVYYSVSPRQTLLAEDMKRAELLEVFSQLNKKGISYRFEGQGGKLYVEALKKKQALKILEDVGESKRAPQKTKNLFSKPYFGLLTAHLQKIKYHKALQEELSDSINHLMSVKSSKVILPTPRKRHWYEKEDKKNKSTASVILDLHEGEVLSAEQIQGIVFLVSGALQDLKPEQVMVLNSQGDVLSSFQPRFSKSVQKLNEELKRKHKDKKPIISSHVAASMSQASELSDKGIILSPWLLVSLLLSFVLLGFGLSLVLHFRRKSELQKVEMVLPRTVEELEEWHSETFQVYDGESKSS